MCWCSLRQATPHREAPLTSTPKRRHQPHGRIHLRAHRPPITRTPHRARLRHLGRGRALLAVPPGDCCAGCRSVVGG
ncbi:hypothetical protein ACFFX0_11510 [Citricoccus parietis]|uniref:Uncharacterized protein n=1 Tax=Citricoccus parietis TaxID=592307 RepID=A0ABV5FYQ0_9MICC